MTDEEKKEFEEFLQWKKEKAEREQAEKETKTDEESFNTVVFVAVMLAVIAAIAFMIGTCSHKAAMTVETVAEDSIEEPVEEMEVVSEEPTLKTWDFTFEKDPMTDSKNIWARVNSDNYITQDFPYNGYTFASITVRYMKKYGYDVLVQINKGQINGRSYHGTDYVTARFDEGTPKKYYFNEAADGSSEVVFLRNASDFISHCKKAKDIKIDIPIYKGGRPVFSFHVDEPLVWREE